MHFRDLRFVKVTNLRNLLFNISSHEIELIFLFNLVDDKNGRIVANLAFDF